MLGRNPAYIQQFVRRGVPKRLKEEERRKLARYFAVSEALLGGPRTKRAAATGWSASSATRCAFRPGPGAIVTEELGQALFRVRRALAESADRELRPSKLSIVRVEGDSMAPTLNAGRRHPGRPRRLRRSGCATASTCCGSTMRWWSSGSRSTRRAPGDGPVGQSRLSRLARLRPRRDQLHRPGDLGRPARSSSRRAGGRSATGHDRERRADRGADQHALHRIADRQAGEEAAE